MTGSLVLYSARPYFTPPPLCIDTGNRPVAAFTSTSSLYRRYAHPRALSLTLHFGSETRVFH